MNLSQADEVSALNKRVVELENAEKELRDTQERYQRLVENSPDPIVIHQDRRLVFVNEAAVKALAAGSQTDLLGREIMEFVHPDYREMVRQNVMKMVATGLPNPMMEEKFLRSDGAVLTAEVVSAPITYLGKPAFQVIFRDITEKKNLVGELKESEERYRLLVENAPDPIVVYKDGILIYANDEAAKFIAAPSREELIGRPILQFIHPDEHQAVKERVKFMMETGQPAPTREYRYVRMDGEEFFAEISSTPISYRGQPAFQAILRDVSKRKELEESLREAKEIAEKATKLKDCFVGIVAHDLKSPFNSITGLIKHIVSDRERHLHPYHKGLLEKTLGSCQGLLNVIDNLLDVNRLKSGKITLSKKHVYANPLTEQKTLTLKYLAESKGIKLRNEIPADMRVYADPVLFGECISNLISNSIKFCGKDCEISVFRPAGKHHTLAVRDNGVGIAKNLASKIFGPENKISSVGTAGEVGSGIGLPFCRDVLEAHGGSITFESEPGAGSTFYMTLPEVKPVILVVDDDPVVRFSIEKYLEELDVKIIEAQDGVSALESLKTATPDLVITDVNMPRMGGIELVRKLKSSPKTSGIPILAITGEDRMMVTDMDVRSYMFRIGCDDFANKPFERKDILPRVQKLIGN